MTGSERTSTASALTQHLDRAEPADVDKESHDTHGTDEEDEAHPLHRARNSGDDVATALTGRSRSVFMVRSIRPWACEDGEDPCGHPHRCRPLARLLTWMGVAGQVGIHEPFTRMGQEFAPSFSWMRAAVETPWLSPGYSSVRVCSHSAEPVASCPGIDVAAEPARYRWMRTTAMETTTMAPTT